MKLDQLLPLKRLNGISVAPEFWCQVTGDIAGNRIFTQLGSESSGGVATGTAHASAENPARFIQLRRSWIYVVAICLATHAKEGTHA